MTPNPITQTIALGEYTLVLGRSEQCDVSINDKTFSRRHLEITTYGDDIVFVNTGTLTTIGDWQVGTPVNLEKALTPTTRLGGHMVSGHVDGVGEVLSRHSEARAEHFRLRAPKKLAKYIAHKGSITVDGTSLTVNKVEGDEFELTIVPHTLEKTVIDAYQPGCRVNLEVDLIARYLERLLLGDKAAEK